MIKRLIKILIFINLHCITQAMEHTKSYFDDHIKLKFKAVFTQKICFMDEIVKCDNSSLKQLQEEYEIILSNASQKVANLSAEYIDIINIIPKEPFYIIEHSASISESSSKWDYIAILRLKENLSFKQKSKLNKFRRKIRKIIDEVNTELEELKLICSVLMSSLSIKLNMKLHFEGFQPTCNYSGSWDSFDCMCFPKIAIVSHENLDFDLYESLNRENEIDDFLHYSNLENAFCCTIS